MMRIFLLLVLAASILAYFVVWGRIYKQGLKNARFSLERQAVKHSGHFWYGVWPMVPRLDLPFRDEIIKITVIPRKRNILPHARMVWHPISFNVADIEIQSRSLLLRFLSSGKSLYQTGDVAFDKRYIVITHDSDVAARLLDRTVRRLMILQSFKAFAFSADQESVKMSIIHNPEDFKELDAFIELILLVAQRLANEKNSENLQQSDLNP